MKKIIILSMAFLLVSCTFGKWIKDVPKNSDINPIVNDPIDTTKSPDNVVDDTKVTDSWEANDNTPNQVVWTGVVQNTNTWVVIDLKKFYALLDSKKYTELEDSLNKEDQSNKEVIRLTAKSKFSQKKYEEALALLEKDDKLFWWKDEDVVFMMGVIYHNLWDITKAKEYINSAIKINPKFDPATNYLKIIDKQEKDQAAAEEKMKTN